MQPFHCPTCGTLLGKSDGERMQTFCRHCHAVRMAYVVELARATTQASSLVGSGRARQDG
jgi:uncharacterized Zn finger protein (UPF0148 family)